MSAFIVIYVLFAHWFCDFLLQTDKQATNKSTNLYALIAHTIGYSFFMTIFMEIVTENNMFGAQHIYASVIFGLAMFITHTLIDFVTSRINSKLWKEEKRHWFFTMIGFDQWLHYVTIFTAINLIYY